MRPEPSIKELLAQRGIEVRAARYPGGARELVRGADSLGYFNASSAVEAFLPEPTDTPAGRCHGASDGECFSDHCPQLRDNEPAVSGRHCPLDHWCRECGADERLGPCC